LRLSSRLPSIIINLAFWNRVFYLLPKAINSFIPPKNGGKLEKGD